MSQGTTRDALIREQSAALAAVLNAGLSDVRGGSAPLPPTPYERRLLDALSDGRPRRPDELIASHPGWFAAGTPARSATASVHLTAASLVRKGWVSQHKRTHASTYRRAYKITEAGKRA